jgi:hypothetical protein
MATNQTQFQNRHVLRPYFSVAHGGNMSLMGYEDEGKAAEWAMIMTAAYPLAWPQFPVLHREFGYERKLPVIEVRRTNFEIMMGGHLCNGRGAHFSPGVQTVGWGLAAQITIEMRVADYILAWESPEFGWRKGMRKEIKVSSRFIGRWAQKQFKAWETKANTELQSTLEYAWWVTIGRTGSAPVEIPAPQRPLAELLEEVAGKHEEQLIWANEAQWREIKQRVENMRRFLKK